MAGSGIQGRRRTPLGLEGTFDDVPVPPSTKREGGGGGGGVTLSGACPRVIGEWLAPGGLSGLAGSWPTLGRVGSGGVDGG